MTTPRPPLPTLAAVLGLGLSACAAPPATAPAPVAAAPAPPPPSIPDWRALPPDLTRPAPPTPTKVVTRKMPGGLTLVMATDPKWSVTYMAWAVPGGVLQDGKRLGLGALASDALPSSRSTESAEKLGKAARELGVRISTDSTSQSDEITLWVPSHHALDAVGTLAGLLKSEPLPENALKHALNARVDAYFELLDRPAGRFALVVEREIFGPTHPFGKTPLGEPRTLARIETKDVANRLARLRCPTGGVLVVAGDFDPIDMAQAVRRELPKERCRRRVRPPPRPAPRPGLRFMARKGLGQVSVRAGLVAQPGASAADLDLVSKVLMGNFDASVSRYLRGELGASYSSLTYVDARPGATVLRFTTEVDPAQAGTVVQLLRDVVDQLTAEPLDAEALEEAATRLGRGARRRHFVSARGAAETLRDRFLAKRDLMPEPQPVDAEALRQRLAKSLDSRRWVVLMMGDPDKTLPPLKAADVGPVRLAR